MVRCHVTIPLSVKKISAKLGGFAIFHKVLTNCLCKPLIQDFSTNEGFAHGSVVFYGPLLPRTLAFIDGLSEKIDGPGKWKKTHLNQWNPSILTKLT